MMRRALMPMANQPAGNTTTAATIGTITMGDGSAPLPPNIARTASTAPTPRRTDAVRDRARVRHVATAAVAQGERECLAIA